MIITQLSTFIPEGAQLAFLLMLIVVFVAIGIDLFTGYRKARLQGKARTSKALQRTINKFNRYYCFLFGASLIDLTCFSVDIWLRLGWDELPYISALCTIFTLYIELKSIYENVWAVGAGEEAPEPHPDFGKDAIALLTALSAIFKHDPEELIKLLRERQEQEQGNKTKETDKAVS